MLDLTQLLSQLWLFGGPTHAGYHKWRDSETKKRFNSDFTVDENDQLPLPTAQKLTYENLTKSLNQQGFDWPGLMQKNNRIAPLLKRQWIFGIGIPTLHAGLIAIETKRMAHEKLLVTKYNTLPEPNNLKRELTHASLSTEQRRDYKKYKRLLGMQSALRWMIGIFQTGAGASMGLRSRYMELPNINDIFSPTETCRIDQTTNKTLPSNYIPWYAPLYGAGKSSDEN